MNNIEYTQHFLNDHAIAEDMLNYAQINGSDMVIDIGAGKGTLTSPLSRRAERVIAVELDDNLANQLKIIFDNHSNVNVLNLNFLDMPLPNNLFKVVANIPYNITTDIFGYLLDIPQTSFTKGVIVTEWGVAKRFTEHSTDPRIIGWNTWFNLKIMKRISPKVFSPSPSVQSAIVKIDRRSQFRVNPTMYYEYMAFVSSLLEYPRMRAKEALKPIFSWNQIKRISRDAGINYHHPIGILTVSQWTHCFNTMHKLIPNRKRVHPSMPGKYKQHYKR